MANKLYGSKTLLDWDGPYRGGALRRAGLADKLEKGIGARAPYSVEGPNVGSALGWTQAQLDAHRLERQTLFDATGLDIAFASRLLELELGERVRVQRRTAAGQPAIDGASQTRMAEFARQFVREDYATRRLPGPGPERERLAEALVQRTSEFIAQHAPLRDLLATGTLSHEPEILEGLMDHVLSAHHGAVAKAPADTPAKTPEASAPHNTALGS